MGDFFLALLVVPGLMLWAVVGFFVALGLLSLVELGYKRLNRLIRDWHRKRASEAVRRS